MNKNKKNNFNVAAYAAFLYNEFVQEREACIVDDANESIQIDSANLADLLYYDCEVRGLSEQLIKEEYRIASYAEFQQHVKEIAVNPNDEEFVNVSRNLKEIKSWAKEQWVQACKDLDKKLVSYDKEETELMGDTREDIKILRYLEHFAPIWGKRCEEVKLLNNKTKTDWDLYWKNFNMLRKAKERLFARRDNEDNKLSYDLFVKSMLIVTEQLSKLGNSRELHETFLEMLWKMQTVNNSGVREESCGSMRINMEALIDLKMAAERVANRHNVTVEEAFLMLQDEEYVDEMILADDLKDEEELECLFEELSLNE